MLAISFDQCVKNVVEMFFIKMEKQCRCQIINTPAKTTIVKINQIDCIAIALGTSLTTQEMSGRFRPFSIDQLIV